MWDDRFEDLLRGYLPHLPPGEPLVADMPLRELGLDSMSMVELLSAVENQYGIRLADEALSLETFETPGRLWRTLTAATA